MPPSRRRPWPYDIIVAGVGMMLTRDNKGIPSLRAIKAQPLPDQPQPGDVGQESAPPVIETPHSWGDLSLGFGLSVDVPQQNSLKYNYAIGVDASCGGFIMKGPLITTCTPTTRDTTNGITQFVELPNGSLFAANGRYFQKRASDNPVTGWAPSKDFGAGVALVNAAVHQSDSGSPANATIYAAMTGSNDQYSADGTTWTVRGTFQSIDYFVVSRELNRVSDVNQVSKCDAGSDPTIEANFSNANSFRIGDKQYPVNQVHITSVGYPLFMKQDGLYTLDSAGQDSRLYPWFQFGASSEDGHYVWDFGNDTHVTYGNQHVRLVPGMSFGSPHVELQPIGPERSVENTSPVHGRLTAGIGDGTMFAYVGLYNQDTNTSYLMKFSSFVGPGLQPGKLEEAKRIDAWHGSISQAFVSKKITAMHRSRIGAPTGHFRCYIGFSDGTISWFVLPCVANPYLCAVAGNYQFDNATDGTLNFPQFHGGHLANAKSLRGFSVAGIKMTTTEYVTWNYKITTADSSYTPFTDSGGVTVKYTTTPMARYDFQTGTSSYLADIQMVLHNTFSNASPVVTVPTLHFAVITPVALRYQGVIDAGGTAARRDGRPMRIGTTAIRNIMKSASNAASGVRVTLPDESTRIFQVINYGENLGWGERARSWDEQIPFEMVEYNPDQSSFASTQTHGIIFDLASLAIGDLTTYSIANLDLL